MERLTIEFCGEYVPKEMCSIDRLGGADDCELCCEYCKATEDGNEDCEECAINRCFNKLGAYENLEERLQKTYGECDGILEKIVEHLERHEGVELPEPVHKARLLTDGEVDRWEEYKCLEKQGKLLKLPCAVGDTVYVLRIDNATYMMNNEKVWEIIEERFEMRHFDCIGKTVFLTREGAEAVLKESGDIRQQDRHSC